MQKNPFVILGINEADANQNDVEQAYSELRKKYQNEMFLDGEAGAEAGRKLDELEQAYKDAKDLLEERNSSTGFGSIYSEVEKLIKNGNLTDAQSKLDLMSVRDGEWHYLQSVIFYKKGWHLESKKQLELAILEDKDNEKYKSALSRLEDVIAGRAPKSDNDGRNNYTDAGNERPTGNANPYRSYDRRNNSVDTACDICNGLICADCCCECMGGDLIRCC